VGDISKSRGKLQNSKFVARAPAGIVAREKQKLADSESAHASLKEQLDRISVTE
jgi:valyl-tRNA synthetase